MRIENYVINKSKPGFHNQNYYEHIKLIKHITVYIMLKFEIPKAYLNQLTLESAYKIGSKLLTLAVHYNNQAAIAQLISKGCYSQEAMHGAIKIGNKEIIQLFIKWSMAINWQSLNYAHQYNKAMFPILALAL